jgi:uncharacterized protein YjbI with pentapeptide repeats
MGANLAGQNLAGTALANCDLIGADFSEANLAYAALYSSFLAGVNFSHANLHETNFYEANVFGANLTGADARGAYGLTLPADAVTVNLIRPDGKISGFDLKSGQWFAAGNYVRSDNNPILLHVDQHFLTAPGGVLQLVFDADTWASTISFAPGIPVTLGGTLDLLFADGVDIASQTGRTFKVFDWTGVAPTGAFAMSSPYSWDLSKLYTTGEVTLTGVPEPTALVLLTIAAAGWCLRRRRIE